MEGDPKPITKTQRKALEWAWRRMKAGDVVDDCHYVRSGVAIWFKGEFGPACTCIEVPRSYAKFLPHPDEEPTP